MVGGGAEASRLQPEGGPGLGTISNLIGDRRHLRPDSLGHSLNTSREEEEAMDDTPTLTDKDIRTVDLEAGQSPRAMRDQDEKDQQGQPDTQDQGDQVDDVDQADEADAADADDDAVDEDAADKDTDQQDT